MEFIKTGKMFLLRSGRYLSAKSPQIFTGLGIGSAIGAVILAAHDTPKATKLLDERRRELGLAEEEPMPVKEVIFTAGPVYVPTMTSLAFCIFCIINLHRVHSRKYAGLAAAYALSENTLRQFTQKTIDKIGARKTQQIKDEIAQDRIYSDAPVDHSIIRTGKGNVLFLESTSGQYFRSDIPTVERDLISVKDMQFSDPFNMRVTLEDVYDALGIERTSIGRDIGWDYHINGKFDYNLIACKLNAEGTEAAIVINYDILPKDFEIIKN